MTLPTLLGISTQLQQELNRSACSKRTTSYLLINSKDFIHTNHRVFSFSFSLKAAAAAAKSLQSCPTLCDLIDGSPSGSPVPGIRQARILEWAVISFSNAWKRKVQVKLLSRIRLLATPGLQSTRLLHSWDFPGKSTGVGCHCLLHRSAKLKNKIS